MRRDLNTAVMQNLAIFREEPEYSALNTLYSVPVIDMTLSAFVLVVASATDQPPTAWTDIELILAALVIQLPLNGQKNTTYMIDSAYLRWLLPTRVDLEAGLKAVAQDQQLRLPHLGLLIPKLKFDQLSPWHQARLQMSRDAFAQLRQALTITGFDAAFSHRVDEALVVNMYLEGRQVVQRFSPDVLQHVLLGDMIFEAHFFAEEYPALLNYLSDLFDQLPITQAQELKAVVLKVRPYVVAAVRDDKWFSPQKRHWIAHRDRMIQPLHLLTLREVAERRGIVVTGTAKRWRLALGSVEDQDHLPALAQVLWHANNAGRARKILLPVVQNLPPEQLPGRINVPTAIAAAALLGDLMYANHLQTLPHWQPQALEDVLLTIMQPLHAHTKADFCEFVRMVLLQMQAHWAPAQAHALLDVVAKLTPAQ